LVPNQALAGGSLSAFVAEQAQASGAEHLAPENDVERLLVAIWQELLLIRPIGTDEEFLALGGNSVQVMQMLRMAKARGLGFSVKDVCEAKTVKELARRVSRAAAAVASTPLAQIPPLWPRTLGRTLAASSTPCSIARKGSVLHTLAVWRRLLPSATRFFAFGGATKGWCCAAPQKSPGRVSMCWMLPHWRTRPWLLRNSACFALPDQYLVCRGD
jgi:aryl carrier-like protein